MNPGKALNELRNKKLTPEQRSAIAKKAYQGTKRFKKSKNKVAKLPF